MESGLDHQTVRVLLEWQLEMGVSEAIGDVPVNRYGLPAKAPGTAAKAGAAREKADPVARRVAGPPAPAGGAGGDRSTDAVAAARSAAQAAGTLDALHAALAGFEMCDLRKGARNLVFADGVPGSRVMIVGEAPGRDEDRAGRPFVGRAGQLLDRMLKAIGLSREQNVYITNVLPWRPPQNREPKPDEIAMMKPFLERHVALAAPDILVLMGNVSCDTVLGRRGITRMRGTWERAMDRPVLPMLHPAYLLRQPQAKREAWADLLELNARLKGDV
ncbi:MAG: uracil-DNA glycosylase family protein [Jhaorihella sp.]